MMMIRRVTNVSFRSPILDWVSWTRTSPYITKKIKKIIERINNSSDTLSTKYTQQAFTPLDLSPYGPLARYVKLRVAGNVFPRRRLQRKPLVSDPGMHDAWCMSELLNRGDGENVPGIPDACTCNFTHLVRGPCVQLFCMIRISRGAACLKWNMTSRPFCILLMAHIIFCAVSLDSFINQCI